MASSAAQPAWARYGLRTDFEGSETTEVKTLVAEAEAAARTAGVPEAVRRAYVNEVRKAAVKARKDFLTAAGSWISRAQWRSMTDEERAERRKHSKPKGE